MFSKKLLLFHITLTSLLFGAVISANSQDLSFLSDSVSYTWPTNASTYLSSTFAETRSAHLHSGLDIRTWGREGYDVYATRDAEVFRIAIGPSGYGKVIYLKHPDDSYSVYAHLQRFHPDLQAYADSIRLQDYSFEMDHFPDEGKFTFKQGERIGFTGSTGIGPPHLHFELRTPGFEPFNPLITNLSISDDIPPIINSLAVEHLHSGTLKFLDYEIVQPLRENNDELDFGTIHTDSPIGIAVNAHDRANRTPNFYAVYGILMTADDDTLFHSQADLFGFTEASMMFLDRSYPILAQTRRGYQRMYTVNGNRLPIYKNLKNRGVLGLTSGEQEIKIVLSDYYGNTRTARFTLITDHDQSINRITSVPAYPHLKPNGQPSVKNTHPGNNRSAPAYTISNRNSIPRGPASYDGDYRYMFSDETYSSASIKTVIPGKRNILPSSSYRAWVDIPHNSLYDTLSIRMQYQTDSDLPSIRFQPNRLPVNNSMEITMLLPDDIANDPAIGLYSFDEYRDRYVYLNSTIQHGVLKAKINEFAELQIRRDQTAPWIGRAKFSKDPAGNYVVHVPAVDRDSGIDYRRSTIVVNGKKGIIEYEKDNDRLIFYNPGFTPKNGVNQVEIKVYDRTGNESVRSYKLNHTQ